EDRHIETKPQLAEANTYTYGTRVDFENAEVDLSLNVRRIFFSTYDISCLNDCYYKVSSIYDHLVIEEILIKKNLENGNPEV
ncbi:octopine dehydrogenase, partial [Staphylococcus aureus]|nr:octopine dehydrogenase [Staphylococcus aureus]